MFVDSYRPNWLRITDEKGTVFMEQCLFHCKRKINQCVEKAPDLCYPFFISLGL